MDYRKAAFAFVCLLGFAILPALGQTTTDDTQEAARKQIRDEARRQAEAALTKNLLVEFISTAQETDDLLGDVQKKADVFFPRIESLLSNDDGKRIALDDAAFINFMHLREEPPPSRDEIAAKKAGIETIIKTLKDQVDSTSVGYVPPISVKDDVARTRQWALESATKINDANSWIDAELAKTKSSNDLSKSPTLKERIDAYNATKLDMLAKSRLLGEKSAEQESQQKMQDAARIAALMDAQAKSDQLVRDMRAELEREHVEHDMELKKMKSDQDQKVADLQQQLATAEANRSRQAAASAATIDQGKEDAEKTRLRQKCNDPHVQELLRPFTTLGYWQPAGSFSLDKVPVSFAKIREGKALNRDEQGLLALVAIAENRGDRLRPRWSMPPNPRRMTAAQLEEAKEAQDNLNELGPTMVELGMLSP